MKKIIRDKQEAEEKVSKEAEAKAKEASERAAKENERRKEAERRRKETAERAEAEARLAKARMEVRPLLCPTSNKLTARTTLTKPSTHTTHTTYTSHTTHSGPITQPIPTLRTTHITHYRYTPCSRMKRCPTHIFFTARPALPTQRHTKLA